MNCNTTHYRANSSSVPGDPTCAGRTYSKVHVPGLVVLLGPNHSGLGAPLAIVDEGEWETPFGRIPIDAAIGRRLRELNAELSEDALAHAREHSLEVQVPFIQVLRPDARIVPISVGTRKLGDLLGLGDALAEVIRTAGEEVLIVISSDMSHYIPFEKARARDSLAIEEMERVDSKGLHEIVEREDISMCGYCPAVAGLRAARALGASRGTLVAYTSSGDRSGDYSRVVAYAGLIFN